MLMIFFIIYYLLKKDKSKQGCRPLFTTEGEMVDISPSVILSSLTTCSGREVSSDNRHLPEPTPHRYYQ
uniref:Uncharacterized protein n=2 Tax=unclassified Caudoviricetes TaxID=2788787 RepID=A0A8S5PJ98_9CAUD|nr:MAG TPA: hypothetical protein [Siphoviridae sp. ctJcm18]DAE06669.1 MAG TPA: hypothetical protein [Siphoviridae sp. ctUGQ45]